MSSTDLPEASDSSNVAGAPSTDSDDTDGSEGAINLALYDTNLTTNCLNTSTHESHLSTPSPFFQMAQTSASELHDSVAPLGISSQTRDGGSDYASAISSGNSYYGTTIAYPAAIPSTSASPVNWSPNSTRPRGNSGASLASLDTTSANGIHQSVDGPRPERPAYGRTPSNAYAPLRRPSQYPTHSSRYRASSSRPTKINADADYRAQKKAYAQRLQRDNPENDSIVNPDDYPPSLGYSSGSETDDDSPSTADYLESDLYDQETMLYYDAGDVVPSEEELKIPENRERLEWHSMLANVLTGDVVRQEKKRLTGASDPQTDDTLKAEMWLGIRARICGRTIPAQKRMLDDQRTKIPTWIEEIVSFEIKGQAEVGKTAKEQVEEIVNLIEKCEKLYPTRMAFMKAHPRADSDAYSESCNALISWLNTNRLITTELEVLQNWVGNAQLNFQKPRERSAGDHSLQDDTPFIDRILKEDGLKSLQGEKKSKDQRDDPKENSLESIKSMRNSHPSILQTVNAVVDKAKMTLIENATFFAQKHLPPYIEELLTLINFPSRLIQEIISVRLKYAGKIKDPEMNLMMAEQMISQFQILLTLAVKIKSDYLEQAAPEPGWELPPCIDENFDSVVLKAFKFYFKMLGTKLSSNRNSFKEAEILEQEWGFANSLGRHFDGGDVEVAEQFSKLTSRSLSRLTSHFEKELQRRPNEVAGPEMDKRYKSILDSVRVRQRKLFRFSRLLTHNFENTSEFSISMPHHQLEDIYDNLFMTGHIQVNVVSQADENVVIFASPTLTNRPKEISSLLGTCYRSENGLEDPSNPYLLLVYPEVPVTWEGTYQEVDMKLPSFGIKPGKLRLIAEGSQLLLNSARAAFTQAIGVDLTVVQPQKSNLPSVDQKLQKIKKTAYKLSNTIMDSVEIIRKQLVGLECQELIQNCFSFATEFGQRSILHLDHNRRQLNNFKLTRLALDWVSFICDDCIASDRKTFRWAVVALEFAMVMTRGQNLLSISDFEYARLRSKVAGCMSLLISHFDIMGARSTVAAQAEKRRQMDASGGRFRLDISRMKDDKESARIVSEQWMAQLEAVDNLRRDRVSERQALGHVLEDSNDADRSLTVLSSSATNMQMRWQQGQFIGGGAFGAVYIGHNLDSGQLMAVKEIRLQDPQLIPTIAAQIREEMGVLQILEHENMVKYYGIEVHRDKVFIFMEYCAGGSLAALLEHGRIEDEGFLLVYTLQMLEGLAYLHESGVIHRDIKPENILLDHNGVIKFIDFGAARVSANQAGRTLAHPEHPPGAVKRQGQRSMTGTPMYMSPEIINPDIIGAFRGTPRPGAVDIWSLGCVVLEMATGRRPWASLDNEWAIMYNIAQGNPPQLPTKDQMSEQGIDFLKRCFERDPTKRPSAAELLQHEWIMTLRNQLGLEPQTPSENGSVMTPTSSQSSRSNTGFENVSL